ncbi:MAG TPA: hypothetical protein VE263_02845 [Candidatus Angelobacter sp.]|nr:hypothetical protein [Candidatus Angelobacter sp.]
MRRRYEVWFLRMALADGNGAWWFRYLLTSPGRGGCGSESRRRPVQVWATWFPRAGKPVTWIQGFGLEDFRLSPHGSRPFFFEAGENRIAENECRGHLNVDGHCIRWNLRYRSTFHTQLSSKGWIGFSGTAHSDAVFSGEIALDAHSSQGDPLAYGMQGHNCGYRHRDLWTWTHLQFARPSGRTSTLEALVYDMPLGLVFRRAVLWHEGKEYVFRRLQERLRDPQHLIWDWQCSHSQVGLEVSVRGRDGFVHHLPYVKTDCSGEFEVSNDSLASARVVLRHPDGTVEELATDTGAVLEMVGNHS